VTVNRILNTILWSRLSKK